MSIGSKDKYSYLRKVILFELLAIGILLYFTVTNNKMTDMLENTSVTNILKRDPYEKALIYTYLDKIKKATEEYYVNIYTITPSVPYYVVELKEIKTKGEQNSFVFISFVTKPYIGPHIVIGEDEITFMTSYTGEVELIDFKHLKSYELPDHLKNLKKKLSNSEIKSR